ncbi:MAG: hypothetical protein GAK41_00218 [Burkholderia gladioli]|nr:MAG: hypothetical protein GAK41_00218 [Burkholderia gladioli]
MQQRRATSSTGALSGGNNLATTLSLNACLYFATSRPHSTPGFPDPIRATTILTRGGPRAFHARLHSVGHLIAYAGAGFGWRAVKWHHWPGEARVVFERDATAPAPRELDAPALEAAVGALVTAALPRVLSERDGMRMLAYGALEASPCGGTHVTDTSVVGAVTILKIKEKKGQLTVNYDVAA